MEFESFSVQYYLSQRRKKSENYRSRVTKLPLWAMVAMAASVSSVLLNSFEINILSLRKEKRTCNRRVYYAYIPGISCDQIEQQFKSPERSSTV